jgi:hypothetical protein
VSSRWCARARRAAARGRSPRLRDRPGDIGDCVPVMMADVEVVEDVVVHRERATLRVRGVFLKIDAVAGNGIVVRPYNGLVALFSMADRSGRAAIRNCRRPDS